MTWFLALLLILPATPTMLEAQALHDEQQLWDRTTDVSLIPLQSEPATAPTVETWRYLAEMLYPADPDYALRVLACESNGNPDALGQAGEIGLWQIHGKHWSPLWGPGGPFAGLSPWEPHVNTEIAQVILAAQGWQAWTCARQIGTP